MKTDEVIQVVLADDHRIMREGIRALLDITLLPDGRRVFVMGEAEDGPQAIALCKLLVPKVAVVDISLPGISGFDVTRQLRELPKPPAVVILSMYASPQDVEREQYVGAAAFVVKGSGVAELGAAIARVADGKTGPFPDFRPSLEQLTEREREVLRGVADGRSNKEIALKLGLTSHAVNTHRIELMKKLDARDVASLTRVALQLGLMA